MDHAIHQKDGLLRLSQIIGSKKDGIPPLIPISKRSWLYGVASGKFPQPIKLGPRITLWRAADVLALINGEGGAL